MARKNKEIDRKKTILDNKIRSLTSKFELAKEELNNKDIEEELSKEVSEKNRKQIMSGRKKR